jgi:hypothetical protein
MRFLFIFGNLREVISILLVLREWSMFEDGMAICCLMVLRMEGPNLSSIFLNFLNGQSMQLPLKHHIFLGCLDTHLLVGIVCVSKDLILWHVENKKNSTGENLNKHRNLKYITIVLCMESEIFITYFFWMYHCILYMGVCLLYFLNVMLVLT